MAKFNNRRRKRRLRKERREKVEQQVEMFQTVSPDHIPLETHGMWEVQKAGAGVEVLAHGYCLAQFYSGGSTMNYYQPRHTALFLAAPEMLKALTETVEDLKGLGVGTLGPVGQRVLERSMLALEAIVSHQETMEEVLRG